MRRRAPLAGLLLLLHACAADEPVLSGVPAARAPAGAPGLDDAEAEGLPEQPIGEALATPEGPAPYQKAEGVLVDVRYLGGKDYTEVRDLVSDQLGPLQRSADLPADHGRELAFERGTLQLVDNRIIRVRVPIEPPLRRTAALAACGFPPATGRYITLHREYRLNNEWGFRRIRMMRENRTSELVNVVDAWLRVPGERGPQR